MSNNPFVGFDPFQKQDREHPYGEDAHLDSDSILERYGDVDTGDNYYEPDDYDEDDDFQDHSESKQYIAKQEEISNFEALARVAGMISPFLAYGVGVSTAMWGKNTAKAIGEAASKIKRGQMPNKEDLQRIVDAKPREGAVHEIPQEGLVKIGNAMDELRAANRQLVINNESPAEYFSRRQEELEQSEAGRDMGRAGVWEIEGEDLDDDAKKGSGQEKVKQGRRLEAARNVGARGRGEAWRAPKFREGELAEWEEGLDPETRRAVSGKRDVDESGGGFRTWHPADRDIKGHPVTREDAMGQPPKNQTSAYGNAARKQPQFPPPYTGGEKGEIVTKSHEAMIKALGSAIEFMEKRGGSETYHDPEGNYADNPRDTYENVTSEWDLDEWDDMDAEEYPYELNAAQEEEQRQLYDNERRQTTRPSGENAAYEEIQSSADSEFAKTLGILINRLEDK